MANGSFHDELLSVHKTQTVSLTHRITRISAAKDVFEPQRNPGKAEGILMSNDHGSIPFEILFFVHCSLVIGH